MYFELRLCMSEILTSVSRESERINIVDFHLVFLWSVFSLYCTENGKCSNEFMNSGI